jgi:trigger factor
MDVRVNRTNEVSQDVEVEIPQEDVEREVTKKLKQLSSRVREPGFRKGKVPLKIVRRKYGQSARADVIRDLVNDYAMKALEDDKLEKTVHMSRPELKDGVKSGPVTFAFTAENMPDVTPSGYIGLTVEREKVEVTDEDVENELKELQEEFTQLVPVEDRDTVEDGDVVTVDYQAKGKGPVEDIHQEGQEVDLNDEELLEGFADGLIGATIDEPKTIQVVLPDEFSIEELAGEEIDLEVTVRSIQREERPEIDDDLAAESGEADTIDELRTQIRENLEKQRTDEAENQARRRLVEQIIEAHEMTIPPLYVESQAMRDVQQRLQMFQQQGLDPSELGLDPQELVETSKPNIERSIREAVLLRGIAENEEIAVEDSELDAEIDKMAEERGVPRQRIAAQLNEPQQKEQFRTQILFDRVLDFVWSEARVEVVDEVSDPETNEESEPEASDEASDDE